MSPADSLLGQAMVVVQAAQAWVRDSTSITAEWTTPVDNALVEAVDAFEFPQAFAANRKCLADASLEHFGQLAGRYVCSRVPGHQGAHRYQPWAELIAELA